MTVIIDGHEVHIVRTAEGDAVRVTMSAAILFRLLKAAKDKKLEVGSL